MKFLPKRHTTDTELLATARQELANAKTPEDREKFQTAVELIEAGAMPPWIKRTGKNRG